jgi:hypothetical protein
MLWSPALKRPACPAERRSEEENVSGRRKGRRVSPEIEGGEREATGTASSLKKGSGEGDGGGEDPKRDDDEAGEDIGQSLVQEGRQG